MTAQASAIQDRPRVGILLMLGAWLFFSCVDTAAKWMAVAGFPAMQLAFMRYFGHLVIALGFAGAGGLRDARLPRRYLWPVVTRAMLLILATVSNFYVLKVLSLTVTSAIMFSAPIIVCLLMHVFFAERIGPVRWSAIVLGFCGVLIVIRPFGETFHWAMLMCVYNAISLALYSIMTRRLSGEVSVDVMQLYMGGLGTVVLLPFAVLSWRAPADLAEWLILISLGVFGWAGHQLLTTAHRFGTASTLMPYTYTFIIYLSISSYVVFDQLPDLWTIIGAAVITLSGLIIWSRERR